ncbi:hypothetical protein Q7C36_014585 [Tachysurus vachellii]|uniref:Basic leucine zipper domain-containing protein n=1 Tax=Tachysurus vachellii TaxID=175792 RepID=A0AA88MEW1_TACVA|nr:hypothetical protein Q7C36_014585 [Tachysurus vachellii]
MNGGPSSAFVQNPFHYYRDIAADYFTTRRLLHEVHALGSRFDSPRDGAWLLHLVPNCVEPEEPPDSNGYKMDGINLDSATQLIQSSVLLSGTVQHQNEGEIEVHPQWPNTWSTAIDFESLFAQHVPDMDPINYNASPQDPMVSSNGDCRPNPFRGGTYATPHHMPLFSLESINSYNRDTPSTAVSALALPPFSSLRNNFHGTSYSTAGYLHEAVFEQIDLLGLEGLGSVDEEVINGIYGSLDTPWLEEVASSMSSRDSFCKDGAMGYSTELEYFLGYGGACASSCYDWPQVSINNIWHDHNYNEPGVEEPGWDEQRLQALGFPFSAPEIVNMPVEDFLELLEGRSLSTSEVMLLRDVRRHGKKKLAAKNCRKGKLSAILGVQAELRDEHGQSLNQERYTPDCGTNGRIVVRPRTNAVRMITTRTKTTNIEKDKKTLTTILIYILIVFV